MIEVMVRFSEHDIIIGCYIIRQEYEPWVYVIKDGIVVKQFDTNEEAITYCVEQINVQKETS